MVARSRGGRSSGTASGTLGKIELCGPCERTADRFLKVAAAGEAPRSRTQTRLVGAVREPPLLCEGSARVGCSVGVPPTLQDSAARRPDHRGARRLGVARRRHNAPLLPALDGHFKIHLSPSNFFLTFDSSGSNNVYVHPHPLNLAACGHPGKTGQRNESATHWVLLKSKKNAVWSTGLMHSFASGLQFGFH